jgi:outer membrane protein assembly factor BamD
MSDIRGPMAPRLRALRWSLALAAATALAAPAIAGCGSPEPKTALGYTADAKRAYEKAMVEFEGRSWLEAQSLMRDVKRKFSYSKYARLAELRLADIDFEQDKFADAMRGYRAFVHDHRSDVEEVTYARSRIAEAQYRQISESVILPSADERDQAAIRDAHKELRGFLYDYPSAKQAKRVRELLEDVTARLVRHELYVARFYLRRDNYDAAVGRVLYALRNYAATDGPLPGDESRPDARPGAGKPKIQVVIDSGLEAEALLLLGETYLKMHKWREAREAFESILSQYAKSPFTVPAQNYLAFMKERGV